MEFSKDRVSKVKIKIHYQKYKKKNKNNRALFHNRFR